MNDIDKTSSAQVEYGSLEPKAAAETVSVTVSAPYIPGKNMYFAVRTIGTNKLQVRNFKNKIMLPR